MQNQVIFCDAGRTLTARLAGEIDHHSAKGSREAIDIMIFKTKPEILVLDFSDVKFMDSSGIGLIMGRVVLCRTHNCRVRLCGLSTSLKKLVRLSGLERLAGLSIT